MLFSHPINLITFYKKQFMLCVGAWNSLPVIILQSFIGVNYLYQYQYKSINSVFGPQSFACQKFYKLTILFKKTSHYFLQKK